MVLYLNDLLNSCVTLYCIISAGANVPYTSKSGTEC